MLPGRLGASLALVALACGSPSPPGQLPSARDGIVRDPTSQRGQGLGKALDLGTRKSHSIAENTAFITGFFRGLSTRDSFTDLVTSFYFIYKAMEFNFEKTTDERVRALDLPELRRLQALQEDMRYFHPALVAEQNVAATADADTFAGAVARAGIMPSEVTKRYVERIHRVAREEPYLLIAHQYTRYLGDLFGGQMMGGMARRSLKLPREKGTAFYGFKMIPTLGLIRRHTPFSPYVAPRFPHMSEINSFFTLEEKRNLIEVFYTRMNALGLTEEQQEAIVKEANVVFALNIELFEELEGRWPTAVTSLASAVWSEWSADWSSRITSWFAALPSATANNLRGCAAFVGGVLAGRLDVLMTLKRLTGAAAPPPASKLEGECEQMLEAAEEKSPLPDFPGTSPPPQKKKTRGFVRKHGGFRHYCVGGCFAHFPPENARICERKHGGFQHFLCGQMSVCFQSPPPSPYR